MYPVVVSFGMLTVAACRSVSSYQCDFGTGALFAVGDFGTEKHKCDFGTKKHKCAFGTEKHKCTFGCGRFWYRKAKERFSQWAILVRKSTDALLAVGDFNTEKHRCAVGSGRF